MFKIDNITVKTGDKEIIKDFSLELEDGTIHAIMGPNGTGKSTICRTILHDPNYELINGTISYKDKILNDLSTTDIARMGIFLLNQNPIAIEGVTNADLLRSALSEISGERVDIFKFNKEVTEICKKLDLPTSFIHRNINEGASGGERKKNELLHMWMLKPSFIILDEVDSGLDVDALKTVAKSINEYYREYKPTILIITHHTSILNYIKPDYVHVMNKTIIKTGDINLAREIEENGYNLDK